MPVSSGLPAFRVIGLIGVAGAVGGAALDQIHVQSGVLSYPHPALLDQAWWVAPQFGVAVLVMLAGAGPAVKAAAKLVPRPTAGQVATEAVWFVGAYAASGVFGNGQPVALALAYAVTWLVRLVPRPDRLVIAATALVLAASGVLYEGTLAGTGAFHYTHADVYHVPIWLAGIYLHGAPLLVAVARSLVEPPLQRSRHETNTFGPRS